MTTLRMLVRDMLVEMHGGEWAGGQHDVLHEPDDAYAYDNEGSSAGAGYLPKQNLFHLARHAQSCHDLIDDGDPVEDWVEDKISRALADMEDVASYVGYRKSRGERMSEAYRQPDYSDDPTPTFDEQAAWKGYFEDAHEGLGMDVYDATRYADKHASADSAEHGRQVKRHALRTKPSRSRGQYPG